MQMLRFVLLLALLPAGACNLKTSDQIDADKVNQEIRDRKIRRFTDAEIADAAYKFGRHLADTLSAPLAQAPCESSVLALLPAEARAAVAEAQVVCTPPQQVSEKEAMIWQAYQYNTQQQLPLTDNSQKINDSLFLYTSPLEVKEGEWRVLRLVVRKKDLIRTLY